MQASFHFLAKKLPKHPWLGMVLARVHGRVKIDFIAYFTDL